LFIDALVIDPCLFIKNIASGEVRWAERVLQKRQC